MTLASTRKTSTGAVVRSPNAYVPPALRKQMAAAAAGGAGGSAKKSAPAAPPPLQLQPKRMALLLPVPPPLPLPSFRRNRDNDRRTTPVVTNPPIVYVKVPSPSIPQEPHAGDASGKKSSEDANNPLMGDFRSFVSARNASGWKRRKPRSPKRRRIPASPISSRGRAPSSSTRPCPWIRRHGAKGQSRRRLRQASLSQLQKSSVPRLPIRLLRLSPRQTPADRRPPRAPHRYPHRMRSARWWLGSASAHKDAQKLAESKAMLQKMTIPKIPPFNPDKFKARQAGGRRSG